MTSPLAFFPAAALSGPSSRGLFCAPLLPALPLASPGTPAPQRPPRSPGHRRPPRPRPPPPPSPAGPPFSLARLASSAPWRIIPDGCSSSTMSSLHRKSTWQEEAERGLLYRTPQNYAVQWVGRYKDCAVQWVGRYKDVKGGDYPKPELVAGFWIGMYFTVLNSTLLYSMPCPSPVLDVDVTLELLLVVLHSQHTPVPDGVGKSRQHLRDESRGEAESVQHQRSKSPYGKVWYSMVQYGTVWYSAVRPSLPCSLPSKAAAKHIRPPASQAPEVFHSPSALDCLHPGSTASGPQPLSSTRGIPPVHQSPPAAPGVYL